MIEGVEREAPQKERAPGGEAREPRKAHLAGGEMRERGL